MFKNNNFKKDLSVFLKLFYPIPTIWSGWSNDWILFEIVLWCPLRCSPIWRPTSTDQIGRSRPTRSSFGREMVWRNAFSTFGYSTWADLVCYFLTTIFKFYYKWLHLQWRIRGVYWTEKDFACKFVRHFFGSIKLYYNTTMARKHFPQSVAYFKTVWTQSNRL